MNTCMNSVARYLVARRFARSTFALVLLLASILAIGNIFRH